MSVINRILIILFSICSSMALISQNKTLVLDIDCDSINDTIFIDSINYDEANRTSQIICKLSSKHFNTIKSLNVYYDVNFPSNSQLIAEEKGFTYIANGMRAGEHYTFFYEVETKRVRLSEYYYYNLGNVVNDGKDDTVIDLINGSIHSVSYHYDYQTEKLLEQTIKRQRKYIAIYLEEFSSDIDLLDNI